MCCNLCQGQIGVVANDETGRAALDRCVHQHGAGTRGGKRVAIVATGEETQLVDLGASQICHAADEARPITHDLAAHQSSKLAHCAHCYFLPPYCLLYSATTSSVIS